MKKRIWSMFLALAMVLVMIPALGLVAQATEDTTAPPTGSVWLNTAGTCSIMVSAVDASDGYELAGAHMQILDAEGDVVVVEGNKVEWDSTLGTHTIEGLKSNVPYTIRNTTAPAGYVIASDTTFSIDAHGNVSSTGTVSADGVLLVEFAKMKVEVSAVDAANGNAIEGATMQIIDSRGFVAEEWVSTTETHEITGLKAGEEYTLRATVAPDGYAMPTDTQFAIDQNGNIRFTGTVSEDGVLLVKFGKTAVKVSAVDAANGEGIAGATMQVLDKNGDVVEE